MEPIIITLLCVPPIVLVVTAIYLFWQRRILPSPVACYRLSQSGSWISLAFVPIVIWYFFREKRWDYFDYSMEAMFAVLWVVGIWQGVRRSREHRKRYLSYQIYKSNGI